MDRLFFFLVLFFALPAFSQVEVGLDRFFKEELHQELRGKRVALVTNQTGLDAKLRSSVDLFLEHAEEYSLVAFFAPEHGLQGAEYAGEKVENSKTKQGIPIFSLHGKTRRPTEAMLKGIDVIVYDIQDVGVRSYTYATTLFYVMEEAAKRKIQVIVLDRPNPINGVVVDGPMLRKEWRSFIGYLNVPYCHGMTIGELAQFFNQEYRIGCRLQVVAMQGWQRSMSFADTGLTWVPTSPNVPEADSPLFMATTGLLGELGIVNIGIGYTLPFKCVGAPWIDAKVLAEKLNAQLLPSVRFIPFYFRPFYGAYKGENCQGVLISVLNHQKFRPLRTQYVLLGLLKSLYPKQLEEKLSALPEVKKNLFCQANGSSELFELLLHEKYSGWKMAQHDEEERARFLEVRKRHLIY